MNLEEGGEENATLFNDELAKRDIFMIEVSPLEIFEGEEEGASLRREDQREVAKKVFFETVGTIKEVITNIKGKQQADVRKLKRLAQKSGSSGHGR